MRGSLTWCHTSARVSTEMLTPNQTITVAYAHDGATYCVLCATKLKFLDGDNAISGYDAQRMLLEEANDCDFTAGVHSADMTCYECFATIAEVQRDCPVSPPCYDAD